jgi:F-type H+-transporting ATPase subunit gamma
MASLKEIKNRIGSVKNTQQITKAMKLVSTSKLKKAQDNIVGCRPYAYNIRDLIFNISHSRKVTHELLEKKEVAPDSKLKTLYVVVTSDRGLCGGFNNNIARWAEARYRECLEKNSDVDFYFIGKKARDYFMSRDLKDGEVKLNLSKDMSYALAKDVAGKLLKYFTEGEYNEIYVVYNEFKSAIQQDVVAERLLPLKVGSEKTQTARDLYEDPDTIFEPQASEIIDELLKKHFEVQIYRVLSESIASEHAARMTAMDNASNNAKDAIDKLTLTYNKMRQAAITTELIEITSGAEALNG